MPPALTSQRSQRDYLLVCAARDNGDQQAYADLMRLYRIPVYNMLLRMTRNPMDADDLTMESMGKALCQLDNYAPTGSFSSWVFSIATNVFLDFCRKRSRRPELSFADMAPAGDDDADASESLALPADDRTPEEEVMFRQRISTMREVVGQLSPKYRTIIEMRYFQGLSYDEIATKASLPINTVKVQINRAHGLLARLMKSKIDHI